VSGEDGAAGAPAPRRTLRLLLEYDGAEFAGWQRQGDRRSVQGVVEQALARLFGVPTAVVGAGRTDAGVHADGMVASLRTASPMPAADVARALSALLPDDVAVLDARDEEPSFHARRDARWKWYRYTVLRSRSRRVAWRRTAWRVASPLSLPAMEVAAAACRGRHDFAAFQSSGSPRASTVRTMGEEGPLLHVDAVADGFLYGMVRCLAGTLVEVGRGRREAASIAGLLASRDRTAAGAAAPAHGLRLVAVGYAADPAPPFVDPSLAPPVESGLTRGSAAADAPGEETACGS
jgi:tRNA pseudouridine38-40 synthase